MTPAQRAERLVARISADTKSNLEAAERVARAGQRLENLRTHIQMNAPNVDETVALELKKAIAEFAAAKDAAQRIAVRLSRSFAALQALRPEEVL
jgi:hypothetical protein